MAKQKSTKPKVDAKSAELVNVANAVPAGASQADVVPRIAKEPELSFDERTKQIKPWEEK